MDFCSAVRDILGITGKGESAMQTVKMINFILMCLFFACYMYQFLYIPVSWLPRKRRAREAPLHRFAVLIAARNEETVIGNLL